MIIRKKSRQKMLTCIINITILLMALKIISVQTKILRAGHQFEARFRLVDSNSRVMANCVQDLTNTDQRQCIIACIQDIRCSTFNYNKLERICELLNISKFDDAGILERHVGWAHYETDDDASEVRNCRQLSAILSF